MLGLDELHMYDINVPLVQDLNIKSVNRRWKW